MKGHGMGMKEAFPSRSNHHLLASVGREGGIRIPGQ
jgi:hypothetical protein